MNGGGNEHHQECRGRIHLNRQRCWTHHESQRPHAISGKRKRNHSDSAGARTELKQISHPLDGEIDAANERDLSDPSLNGSDDATSQKMSTEGAGAKNQEDKKENPNEGRRYDADVAQEV